MKKKNIFITAALSVLLGLGVTAGISAKFASKPSIDAKADSTYVSGSRVYIEDQSGKGWTENNVDAILHIYNVSFVSGSGYSSYNDIKLNDMYATSFATDGYSYINVRMKWKSGSYRQYEAILPWYIQSFTTEFYATKNNVDRYVYYKNSDGSKGGKASVSISRGDNAKLYMFNKGGGNDCYWSGNDFVAITDFSQREYNYTYQFNGIKSGSHMYLSTQDLTGWEDGSAKIGICFGKSNINQGQSWSSEYDVEHSSLSQAFCWKVKGSGDEHLYECIVPQYNGQDVYWSMVIGVRFKPEATTLEWNDNYIWNKTGDQFYNGDDRDCNMLLVNAATGGSWTGGGYLRDDASISDDTRAGYYGTYFLSQITCNTGSVDTPNNWTNVLKEYKQHLSTDVEGVVWLTSAAITGTDLVKAMYRYDYIVRKYGTSTYSDFIDRKPGNNRAYGFGLLFSSLNKESYAVGLIVISSSIATVAALGGYFFLRKKKQK